MTAYRFRVRYEDAPRTLWRDIVVGADSSVDEFQTVLNRSVGLNQRHCWFFGTDRDYWESEVQYLRPAELEGSPLRSLWSGTAYDAGETTVGRMVGQLDLSERDRICYLFDYGDEWRFYCTLRAIEEDVPSDRDPEVVDEEGDPVEQYHSTDLEP